MCCFHQHSGRQVEGSATPPLLGQFNQITAQLQGVWRTSDAEDSVCSVCSVCVGHQELQLHMRHGDTEIIFHHDVMSSWTSEPIWVQLRHLVPLMILQGLRVVGTERVWTRRNPVWSCYWNWPALLGTLPVEVDQEQDQELDQELEQKQAKELDQKLDEETVVFLQTKVPTDAVTHFHMSNSTEWWKVVQ